MNKANTIIGIGLFSGGFLSGFGVYHHFRRINNERVKEMEQKNLLLANQYLEIVKNLKATGIIEGFDDEIERAEREIDEMLMNFKK